jgi:very-short-patch-repair endonuclease
MAREYALDRDIGGQLHTRGADDAIAALAARQHGVVARWQLLALGLGPDAIDHRLRCGRLHLIHRGVYAVGHRLVTKEGRWLAAVLAAGPGAVLSHRSAAALWGIRPTAATRIEVTTPKQLRPRPNLLPHCAVLPRDEITERDGIPVTTAARTLLDLAATLDRHQLARALDEAEVLRLEGPGRLMDRYPRKRGTKTLRALLNESRRNLRSPLEAEFLALLDDHGFQRPETNTIIEGYEVDAAWRAARLIVELDGYATHGTRRAFERDRARDRRLSAAGWRTARFTSLQLAAPATAAEDLAALGAPRIPAA